MDGSKALGAQPDLNETAPAILGRTLAMLRNDPGFCTQEQWASQLRQRLVQH